MAAIKTRLKTDLVAALKAHDEARKSTVRMALAAIANEEVAGKAARELSDTEEQTVLAREVSKRKDSAEAYTSGNRPELAEKELAEAAILAEYLPQQLTEAEIALTEIACVLKLAEVYDKVEFDADKPYPA